MKSLQILSLCLIGAVLVVVSVLLVLQAGVTNSLRHDLDIANRRVAALDSQISEMHVSRRQFDELRLAIEGYQERIAEVESLRSRVSSLETTNQNQLERIEDLQNEIYELLENPPVVVGETPTGPVPIDEFPVTRLVGPGDGISVMIQRVYGHTNQSMVNWIARVNNIANPNHLNVGQAIVFPCLSEFTE